MAFYTIDGSKLTVDEFVKAYATAFFIPHDIDGINYRWLSE